MAKKTKKPPALEGDFNFLELEHPEFRFVRIGDGPPCVMTLSPIGEIYVCADMTGEDGYFKPRTFLCSEFEYEGKKAKFCDYVCLEPAGGEEYKGVVVSTKGEKIVEMTPFAAGAHSQIIGIKSFLTQDDFEPSVGRNLMRAFEANLHSFIRMNEMCAWYASNLDESDAFLKDVWNYLKNMLGEKKLEMVGANVYDCDYIEDRGEGLDWDTFVSYMESEWNKEYDTVEFAEKYLEKFKRTEDVSKYLDKISINDILNKDKRIRTAERILDRLHDVYASLYDDIYSELSQDSCEELAEEVGIIDMDVCERMEKLAKMISDMEKHAPIPSTEEQYEQKKEEYEKELSRLEDEINEAIMDYASEYADEYIRELRFKDYEELMDIATDRELKYRWVAEKIMDIIKDYCEYNIEVCEDIYEQETK